MILETKDAIKKLKAMRDLCTTPASRYRTLNAIIATWEKEQETIPILVALRQRTNELGRIRTKIRKVEREIRCRYGKIILLPDDAIENRDKFMLQQADILAKIIQPL